MTPRPEPVDRLKELPMTFSLRERQAYAWLYQTGERPWIVDLLTKKVKTGSHGDFDSLIDFATSVGWRG